MKDRPIRLTVVSYVMAFVIGALLFWALGNGWLHPTSAWIFLAGLLGVAVAVLSFAALHISRDADGDQR